MEQKIMSKQESEKVIDEIVLKWNEIVVNLQNTTIQLCLMIQDMMKGYPNETVKDILQKVKAHPNIKRFVSIDRIWQGMRLVHHRPELIEYTKKSDDDRASMDFQNKPYLKRDGEIFWEFYFEIEKSSLNPLEREMLEKEGKSELWTLRQLKQKIQERKDDLLSPSDQIIPRRKEKSDLIRQTAGILRGLPLEKLRDAKKLLEALRVQDIEKAKE